ncbi:hypothetical protein [Vibrio marisflavi]|uniref:Nucleoside transporter/FeoB GTPase Gate domain-containing protein n=1 Tax=Vibrio marisflavi CECT 7928 TaxID=634439 RepID=A0ABM9A6H7_9VIBR|nr:hypothetical protein [Vibrio marisflavi]CAH0540730.1 hypothetical protein VMF7928_03073 [Vibrio marisflavi CECT 7928]
MKRLSLFFRELGKEIFEVTLTLFKIMIPIIFLMKLFEEIGGIDVLSHALHPIMSLVGLPSEMGIVWATALLTNNYAGVAVLLNLGVPLTIAQASVLGSMMLLAHSIPIEGAVAKKAGVSWWSTILLRVGGSLLFGWILHLIYQYGNYLDQPAIVLWQPDSITDPHWSNWLLGQVESLFMIMAVVSVLLFALKVLKLLGIEKLMAILLSPLFRVLGISREATNLTIIGVTLGISFGGGLLINEAKKGHIPARDVFTAVMLLNLLHSLIEDTVLILMIGADFYAIFWGRLVFAVVLVSIIAMLVRKVDERFCEKYFYRSVCG